MKKQEEKQLDFFVEFSLRSNSWLITTGQVALPHPFGKKKLGNGEKDVHDFSENAAHQHGS